MGRYIPGLLKRKEQYDLYLKELENKPSAFRNDKYQVYFKSKNDASIADMSKEDEKAYKSGKGGELTIRKNRYGQELPISMLSVASSSRFCYLSLRDSDLSAFDIHNIIVKRRFEERLPILEGGTPPHMDAYCETDKEVCFFECKCHEQFDGHPIVLSESYFNKGLIVDDVFKDQKPINYREAVKKDGEMVKYPIYSSTVFDGIDNPRFDIKQLLTHLMGIKKKMEKVNDKKARLIYFYFIPDKVRKNSQIEDIECKIQHFLIRRNHHAHHEDFNRDPALIQFLHSIRIVKLLHLGSGKR